MLDDVFKRAYEAWKNYAGILFAIGIVSWAIPIVLSWIVAAIGFAAGIKNPEDIPLWATIITGVAGAALMNGFGIGGNLAVRRKVLPAGNALKFAWDKVLETATATLFVMFPAITGALLGLVVITFMGGAYTWLASILAITGLLGTVLVSTMPYLAAEHGWMGAIDHAVAIGKKIYITLLLVNLFYMLIYITIPAFFPTPESAALATLAIDALFLMHLRHQTFFEIIDSVQVRG